jgi:hypothetical protein
MDCNNARLLLDYARPQACELEASDVQELAQHLSGCMECARAAQAQRQVDGWLGQAMRQAEPPAGLKEQILARLEVEQGHQSRRRLAHSLRAAAAIAFFVTAGWWWWHWARDQGPEIQPDHVWEQAADFANPSRAQVEADFRRWGKPTVAPPGLNYAYLSSYHLSELPGYPQMTVPELIFDRPAVQMHYQARVFIVLARQLPADIRDGLPYVSPSGTRFKLEVLHQPDDRFAYLVFHNGENLDWLRAPETEAT